MTAWLALPWNSSRSYQGRARIQAGEPRATMPLPPNNQVQEATSKSVVGSEGNSTAGNGEPVIDLSPTRDLVGWLHRLEGCRSQGEAQSQQTWNTSQVTMET